MVGYPGLASKGNAITDNGAARDTGIGRQHAIATYADVVRDVDQIVDLGVLTDGRIGKGSAIDTAVGPDGNAVLNNDPAKLWKIHHPFGPGCGPKTGLANHGSSMNVDAVTYDGKPDHGIGPNQTVTAQSDAGPNDDTGCQSGPSANPGPLPDCNAGRQPDALFQFTIGMDLVCIRLVPAWGIQPRRCGRPGSLRVGRQQGRAARAQQIAIFRPDKAGPRLSGSGSIPTLDVRKEGNGLAVGGVEWRDLGKGLRRLSSVGEFGRAQECELLKRRRTQVIEKSWVRHLVLSANGTALSACRVAYFLVGVRA